jgi:hypothetical protein
VWLTDNGQLGDIPDLSDDEELEMPTKEEIGNFFKMGIIQKYAITKKKAVGQESIERP